MTAYPTHRTILHCDLNSYFASVETMRNPALRSVPMIVGGETEDRHGIVLAKNELAKKAGITTGETIWQAKTKCPDLVVVPPQYDDYVFYSRAVRQIYSDYTDQIEAMGIDECWLDVTTSRDLFGDGRTIADTLRERVRRETGLTISVGVSFNKVFAKLGSDMKKPDAVTEIPYERFREIVWPLPACEMLGVGMKTYKKIYYRGCRTIGDIARTKPELLESWLGKLGNVLWIYANGLEDSRVQWQTESDPVKSIGHGTTTVADLETETEVGDVLRELAVEVCAKLRYHHLCAMGVSVQVRENDMVVREYQARLPGDRGTQITPELARAAIDVFRKKHLWRCPIRSVTVRAISLVPDETPVQLDLLGTVEKSDRMLRLEETLDGIRDRFGVHAITDGTYLRVQKLASKRIGYGMEKSITGTGV